MTAGLPRGFCSWPTAATSVSRSSATASRQDLVALSDAKCQWQCSTWGVAEAACLVEARPVPMGGPSGRDWQIGASVTRLDGDRAAFSGR